MEKLTRNEKMFNKKNMTLRPVINADAGFLPVSIADGLESMCEDSFLLTSPRRRATV